MIAYTLYDGRYLDDPDSASCFGVCDTLKEARRDSKDYGDDTVIVKETMVYDGGQNGTPVYRVIKSEIVS